MYIDERVLNKIDQGKEYEYAVYEAERTVVVLGRSRRVDEDVLVENCLHDDIPILRRAGGGGTVVLGRGIIILSVAGATHVPFSLREHMNAVNMAIVQVLLDAHVKDLRISGISDIAIGNRKIVGSSLYRKRDTVLYQGSLLHSPDMSIFDRYLKHPKIEPDYRCGRSHREFLTSLFQEGYLIEMGDLIDALRKGLEHRPPWHGINQTEAQSRRE